MSTPNFLDFMKERDQLDEAFNSAPYELTMGKKNAGDVFFTFIDEDDKEYRIQFYTPQGLGKNVRQVFIGQKRGSVYPDAIARFKNPMRVIASMIEATKQFMATPLGKTIDGYAVNFSKKALDRGMTLIPKIIRQSGLKQKLNVMDLTYSPVPDRGYVWLVKKGKDPAQVFDGPKMKGITWDDPDKVGDAPDQKNTAPQDSTKSVKVPSNAPTDTGIVIEIVPGNRIGGPEMKINAGRNKNGWLMGDQKVSGLYIGNWQQTTERSLNLNDLVSKLKMPELPSSDINKFEKMCQEYWNQNATIFLDPTKLNLPKGVSISEMSQEGFTVIWEDLGFPKVTNLNGLSMFTNVEYDLVKLNSVISSTFSSGGRVSKKTTGIYWGIDKKDLESWFNSKDKENQTTLKNIDIIISKQYNPNQVLLQEFGISEHGGGITWNGMPLGYEDMKQQIIKTITSEDSGDQAVWDNLKIPKNCQDYFKENNLKVIWSFSFPRKSKIGGDAKFFTEYTHVPGQSKVKVSNRLMSSGKALSKSEYEIAFTTESIQRSLNSYSEMYDNAGKQVSLLSSPGYNPNNLFLNDVTVNQVGDILFQGRSLSQSQNRTAILDALSKSAESSESGKTKESLQAYGDSIRAAVPQGRDVDWQVYPVDQGSAIKIDWDITFRRNSRVGAMKEFGAQVTRANQYLQMLYQDAKNKGYTPEEPILMTMADAQHSDDMAAMNGDGPYSEYEQSIGGSLKINLK